MKAFHAIRRNQVFLVVTLVAAIANLWLIYSVAPVVPRMEMARQPFAILNIFFFSLFSFTLILIYLLLYRRYVREMDFERLKKAKGLGDAQIPRISAGQHHQRLGYGAGLRTVHLVAGAQASFTAMNLKYTREMG